MKNLKNTIATIGLAAVLGMSATTANAGLLISDAPVSGGTQCGTKKDDGIISKLKGVIIMGINGVIIMGIDGLIISDAPAPCTDGLLISD